MPLIRIYTSIETHNLYACNCIFKSFWNWLSLWCCEKCSPHTHTHVHTEQASLSILFKLGVHHIYIYTLAGKIDDASFPSDKPHTTGNSKKSASFYILLRKVTRIIVCVFERVCALSLRPITSHFWIHANFSALVILYKLFCKWTNVKNPLVLKIEQ